MEEKIICFFFGHKIDPDFSICLRCGKQLKKRHLKKYFKKLYGHLDRMTEELLDDIE